MELRDLLIAVALYTSCTLGQQCYFPDGSPSPDKPCNPGGGPSACCGTQSDGSPAWCLANGLCFGDLKPSRGSCTDKTWQSTACAQECKDNSPHTGWQLFSCPQADMFSCTDCSETNTSVFPIPPSSLRLSPAQISSWGIPLPTQTVTSSANSAQTSSSGPSCDSSGPSASLVGAVVGACIGCAMLLFAGLFGWEKHKNRRLEHRLRSAENWYKGWSPNDAAAVAGMGSDYSSVPRMPPSPPPLPPPADIKEYQPGDHASYTRREFFARDAKVPVPRHARHEMDAGGVVPELHSPSDEEGSTKLG